MSAENADRSKWTWRGLARAATIALAAAGTGAAMGYVVAHEPPPRASTTPTTRPAEPQRASPTDAERALIFPLREGSTLGGFNVVDVPAIGDDGVLVIVCQRDGATVRLTLALAAPAEPRPAAIVGPYAVFYGVENASAADGERLSLALAEIIRPNAEKPRLQRLRPFVPGPARSPTL